MAKPSLVLAEAIDEASLLIRTGGLDELQAIFRLVGLAERALYAYDRFGRDDYPDELVREYSDVLPPEAFARLALD